MNVKEFLENSNIYPAIARENLVEALISYDIQVINRIINISIDSEKIIANNKTCNVDESYEIGRIFTETLAYKLQSKCYELRNGKYKITVAYKLKSSTLNLKSISYDLLIEREKPKMIEIYSH